MPTPLKIPEKQTSNNSEVSISCFAKRVYQMGRKRKDKVKERVNLSVDADLLRKLEEDGVNKSRLFSISSRIYLRKKSQKDKK